VEEALAAFRGTYDQRPPAYSAVKVAGERAYRRARRGEGVVLRSRRVEVTELEIERFEPPDVGFRATVSGGTYLRSLARDAGEALGCGAHLATLRRTRVGSFRLADALAPEQVTAQTLRDPAELVRDLPARELDDAGRAAAVHGRPVPMADGMRDAGHVALFWGGQLVAVAERVGEVLKPRVVVAEQ